jgi:hypothetical protein
MKLKILVVESLPPGQVIMGMKSPFVRLCVSELMLGQMLEGLESREEVWSKTADWHRGELADSLFQIEESTDEAEARTVGDFYAEIISTLRKQWAAQQRVRVEKLLEPTSAGLSSGWCLFVHSVCDGFSPVEHDGEGRVVVYATRRAAEEAWAEDQIDRLEEFLRGEREGEETDSGFCVVGVEVQADGTVCDEEGGKWR